MSTPAPAAAPRGLARLPGWSRLRPLLVLCLVLSLLLLPGWRASWAVLILRLVLVAVGLLGVFSLFERWPRRLPSWLARWALQVAMVAAAVPFVVAGVYFLTTIGDALPWYRDVDGRLQGYLMMVVLSLLLAPWIAVAALIGQITGAAQRQALAFELERSEFARREADARLRLLQAQVEPHFLFNTLANVRELVDARSPQASTVLGSLIAYLRAAVPRLHAPTTTVAQEIERVRAYLEVMHMRIPDRLQYALQVDDAALPMDCPPMALLTLVENAVRHGIDPSEEGGRIEVRLRLRDGRCQADVTDTGVGLRDGGDGLGTGLANLRERLRLAFDGDARLQLSPLRPQGVTAAMDFPARRSGT
ncbi:sensor histidine kinase [Arenimonas terrae]|uniref:Sensor histidine kinase n=1 Tax=Arenimonas terrae TaxID=2546226 RepID=A0A5C4RWW7_9GAMM|nr:histidine kinase [Arenimonas terrae]TNJ35690.1 sensor histidine kinase [Arenimonas terrae]